MVVPDMVGLIGGLLSCLPITDKVLNYLEKRVTCLRSRPEHPTHGFGNDSHVVCRKWQ